MNIRGSISRCLRECGYDIKDDGGSILLNAFFKERDTGETFALFGSDDDTVNCKDEYMIYFGDAYETFTGGHRLNPEVIHDKLIPIVAELVKW